MRLRHVVSKRPAVVAGFVFLSFALTHPVLANHRVVSANPHAASLPSCLPPANNCTPPMSGIASSTAIDVNAYHVSDPDEVTSALRYNPYSKPKIISDDAANVTPAEAKAWITQTCAAGEHYEHFDRHIGPNAMSGVVIDALADFPSTSRQVLQHIRDASCASDLEPFGTLTRSGREFYWNGRQVSLVGHSWMGALAGLNFNLDGYLNVLESHRVNLTRVWVVEQWTGLLIDKAGAPHLSNAVLPFAGSINFANSNDTLDLQSMNAAFLVRLRQFVEKAAARGIVVQLTLFDRHGLRNVTDPTDPASDYGVWKGSPYNHENNKHAYLLAGATGKAPVAFIDRCLIDFDAGPRRSSTQATVCPDHARSNLVLIQAIVAELASLGNVIYEIMNEPLASPTESWTLSNLTTWHTWVAGMVEAHGQVPPPPPTQ